MATIECMTPKKSVQIRLSIETASDASLVAAALGQTPAEYVEAVVRAALARDMPKAAKILRDRADAIGKHRAAES